MGPIYNTNVVFISFQRLKSTEFENKEWKFGWMVSSLSWLIGVTVCKDEIDKEVGVGRVFEKEKMIAFDIEDEEGHLFRKCTKSM